MVQVPNRLRTMRDRTVVKALGDTVNFVLFCVRRFFADRLNMAAGALTYSTLLALVPLVVIAFAILSSFSAFDAVKERMQELFLGAVVPEVGADIRNYVENFTSNASDLKTVGVVGLAVAALFLLSTIEETLNQVWRVERPRPIFLRFLIFWAILTLGPLLIGASFTMTSDLLVNVERFAAEDFGVPRDALGMGGVLPTIGHALSLLIKVAGFTALFMVVPAKRVKFRHAILGGGFAGIAFEILSWGFNTFLTSGTTYETIYGAVAAVPIFLIWIWTSWTVIIIGAVLAAAFPDWWQARSDKLGITLGPPHRLEAAVALLAVLYDQAGRGGPADEDALSAAAPVDSRESILEALRLGGYVMETEAGQVSLARDLRRVTIADLAADLDVRLGLGPEGDGGHEVVADITARTGNLPTLLERLRGAEDEILGLRLSDLIEGISRPAPAAVIPHVRAGK